MDTSRSELHVIFGAGALGIAIAHQLLANGERVRMVNRSNKEMFSPDLELIIGNAAVGVASALRNRSFTQEVCKGAQVVYHCANPRYHFTKFIKAFRDISTPHQAAIRNTIGWYRQSRL